MVVVELFASPDDVGPPSVDVVGFVDSLSLAECFLMTPAEAFECVEPGVDERDSSPPAPLFLLPLPAESAKIEFLIIIIISCDCSRGLMSGDREGAR